MHSHLLTLTRTLTHPPHSCCFWLLYTFVVSSVVLSPCPSGQRWLERPRSRVARVRGPRQCNPASPIRTPSLSLCLVYLPSSDAAQSSRMRRLAYIREKPTRCSIVWIRMPPTSLLRTALRAVCCKFFCSSKLPHSGHQQCRRHGRLHAPRPLRLGCAVVEVDAHIAANDARDD